MSTNKKRERGDHQQYLSEEERDEPRRKIVARRLGCCLLQRVQKPDRFARMGVSVGSRENDGDCGVTSPTAQYTEVGLAELRYLAVMMDALTLPRNEEFCDRHGAKPKCSRKGSATTQPQPKGGVCTSHGAKR